MNLFRKGNYKFRLTVSHGPNVMYLVTEVLDIGTGLNLMSRSFIKPGWDIYIKVVKDPVLTAETEQAVTVGRDICLRVRLGDVRVRVWFWILDKLAVQI